MLLRRAKRSKICAVNCGSNFSICGTSAWTAATRNGFVRGRFCAVKRPKAHRPTRPDNVRVRSKWGRIFPVRASANRRSGIMTAMTFANTTANDNPVTPVNSAIWIRGQLPCSATPRPFQPKPPKSHPRIHSCATHAQAARNAISRFRIEPRKSRGAINPMNHAQKAKYSPR